MIALLWIGFSVFVLVMLALDLFVVNRKPHVINVRAALGWTGVCIVMALAFNVAVYYIYEHDWLGIGSKFAVINLPDPPALGPGETPPADAEPPKLRIPTGQGKRAATEFFTGWLIEYSLSMDNIFVIALIFAHFQVPTRFQHRVLFWGILGALVLRGIMIGLGAVLVANFEWVLYIFGVILVYTGVKLVTQKEEDFDPEHGWVLRMARRLLPISRGISAERFTARIDGKLFFTPLFIVLLVVETTDVVFAIDSIPAIFGITRDPFLVFTSNIFAIMGLRSLYFALAALMDKFKFVKFSLAFILAFVGVKMMLEGVHRLRPVSARLFGEVPGWLDWLPTEQVHIASGVSLGIIAAALTVGVGTSVVLSRRKAQARRPELNDEPTE